MYFGSGAHDHNDPLAGQRLSRRDMYTIVVGKNYLLGEMGRALVRCGMPVTTERLTAELRKMEFIEPVRMDSSLMPPGYKGLKYTISHRKAVEYVAHKAGQRGLRHRRLMCKKFERAIKAIVKERR